MTRHCRICDKDMESPDDADKEYLFNRSLCSLKCRNKDQSKRRERWKQEGKCINCGKELPESLIWDDVECPECLEKRRNKKFYNIYATDDEIRLGIY